MFKDFKEFAMRGNLLDMAVGIVIGVAFGGIVKSPVSDYADTTITTYGPVGCDKSGRGRL